MKIFYDIQWCYLSSNINIILLAFVTYNTYDCNCSYMFNTRSNGINFRWNLCLIEIRYVIMVYWCFSIIFYIFKNCWWIWLLQIAYLNSIQKVREIFPSIYLTLPYLLADQPYLLADRPYLLADWPTDRPTVRQRDCETERLRRRDSGTERR